MKILFSIIIIFISAYSINAQTINNNVIASGGTILKKDNVQLEYTVGEVAINTLSSNSNKITQGFHQPDIVVSRVAEEGGQMSEDGSQMSEIRSELKQNGELSINVFPNPVTDFVNISSESGDEIQITLLDASGKHIQQLKHQSSTQIDFTNYVAGTYFIVATSEDGKTRNAFKVIKQR